MKQHFKRVTALSLLVALVLGLFGGIPILTTSAASTDPSANTDIEGNPIVNLMEGMNASFEEYSIPGWSVMDGVIQSDEQIYGQGTSWALKLNDSKDNASTWSMSDKNEIKAGEKYTISAQVYGGIGQMTVYFYDKDGKELSDLTISMATKKAAKEWQALSADFTAAANATHVAVKVSSTDAGKEAVYFDEVTLAIKADENFELVFKNGDFNAQWTDNTVPHWTYSGDKISAYDKGNGDLALAIKRTNSKYTVKSERFAVLPNMPYTATIEVLQTAAMNGQMYIKFFADENTDTALEMWKSSKGYVTFGKTGTTEDWATVAVSAVAPATAAYAEVWLTTTTADGSADAPEYTYFDNATFNYATELINPSFEFKATQNDGTPIGVSSSPSVSDAVTSEKAHGEGSQSLLGLKSKLFYSFFLTVSPGQNYEATAYAMLQDETAVDSTCSIAIYFYDETGAESKKKQVNFKPTTDEWMELKVSLAAPDDAVAMRVMVYKANGSGRAYFDDISVVQTTDYQRERNYLNNGGFEQRNRISGDNSSIPSWWSTSTSAPDVFIQDYIPGEHGYVARAINSTRMTMWSQLIPVTEGKTYSVTANAKGEGQLQAYIRYYTSDEISYKEHMLDAAGKEAGKYKSTGNLTNEWTQLAVSGSVAPKGAKYVRILVVALDDNITEKMDFVFDDVCFFEGLPKLIIQGESGVLWNPGFEEIGSKGLPVKWGTFGQNRISIADANVTPDDVYEGRYALRINVPADLSSSHGAQCKPFPVEEGVTYRFSLYAKEDYDTGRGFQLGIKYFDKYGEQLAAFYSTTPATGEWNYSETTGTAPEGTVYATVYLVSGAGKGTVCFDKLSFEAAGSSEYAPVMFDGEWSIAYNEYPRVDFDKDGLERIRKFTKSTAVCAYGYSGTVTMKSLLTDADKYLAETEMIISHKGIQLTYPMYPKLEDFSTREEYRTSPEGYGPGYPYTTAVGQRLVSRVPTLALAYILTGETKYGERAVQYALDICDMEYWVNYYQTIELGGNELSSQLTGYLVECVVAAYDLCNDMLTKEQKVKMEEALIEKGLEAMYHDCWPRMIKDRDMDHANTMVLGACAILNENNIDQLKKYLDMGVTYFNWRLDFFLKSGVNEGHSYDSLAIDDIVKTMYTLQRVTGYTGPMDHAYMEQLKARVLGFFDPVNGTLPSYSDSYISSAFYPYSMAVFSQQGDELATYYLAVGGALSSAHDRLIWFTDTNIADLKTPDEREGNVSYVSSHGMGALRTGWGILDPLLVINATTSEQEHNHYDQNTIMLAFNGMWVLSDSEYKDNSYSDLTTWQMKYTNSTIFVDGKPQVRKGQGTLEQVFNTHIYGYFMGSAPDAYGMEDKKAVLNQFDRHVIMLNHDSMPYYVIIDDLDSNKERNFGWNFYTNGWDRIEIDGEYVAEGTSATGQRLTLARFGNTLHSYFVGEQVTTREVFYADYGPTLVLESAKKKNHQFMNVLSIQKGSGSQLSTLFEYMMDGDSSTEAEFIEEGKISWSSSRTDSSKNTINSVSIGSPLVMFRAGKVGDWISFPFNVEKTQEYGVIVDVGQTMSYDGTWNLYIDDQLIEIFKPNGPSGIISIDAGKMTLEAGMHTVKVIMSGTPNTAFAGTICSIGGITLDTGESMGEGLVKVTEEYNEGDLLGATITYGPVLKDVVLFNRGTGVITGGNLTTNGQQASVIGVNGNDIAEGYAVTKGTSLKYGDQILMTSEGPVSIAMDYTMAKLPVKNDESSDPVETHADFSIKKPVYYVSAKADKATKTSINVGINAPYTVYIDGVEVESSHEGEMLTLTVPAGEHQITIYGTHQHVFDQHNISIKNIKDFAGCGHANVYYVSCICGANGTETFVSGDVKGHFMQAVKAVEATETTNGNIAHWKCTRCGKLFADKEGTQELTASQVIILSFAAERQRQQIITIVSIVAGILVLAGGAVAAILIVKKKKASGDTPREDAPTDQADE